MLLWPTILLLMITATFMVWRQREFFFLWTPAQACRHVYGTNPFVESPAIADYIRSHSTANQSMAILGSEPQMYFYAKRRSATRYIAVHALMEPQPFARKMQEEMCREIEDARPEFLVFFNIRASWLPWPDSDRYVLEWAERYTTDHYHLVGLVDIQLFQEAEYQWGEQATGAKPQSPIYVRIFRRKN